MNEKPPNPIHRRNAILFCGASILVTGILGEPSIPSLFTTQLGAMKIFGVLVAGVIFASLMTQAGERALRSPIEPWYARPGASPLIMFICLGMAILWIIEEEIGLRHGKTVSPEDLVLFCQCLGSGLILIAVLNWVSYEK